MNHESLTSDKPSNLDQSSRGYSHIAPQDSVFGAAIVVPFKEGADADAFLDAVALFANAMRRPIEFVSVVDDAWDAATTLRQLADTTRSFGDRTTQPTRCRLIVSAEPAQVLLDVCANRVVIMAMVTTPAGDDPFVGTHAASLLSLSNEPALLVQRMVTTDAVDLHEVTVTLADAEDRLGILPITRSIADNLGLPARILPVDAERKGLVLADGDRQGRLVFPDSPQTWLQVDVLEGVGPDDGMGQPVPDQSRSPLRCSGSPEEVSAHLRAFLDQGGQTREIVYVPDNAGVIGSDRFVLVLDGSEQAAEAIRPALILAAQKGRTLSALIVTPPAPADAARVSAAVAAQLAAFECDHVSRTVVPSSTLDGDLISIARSGHVPVVSAFGTWTSRNRLAGLLGVMVQDNAPAVVGVGPRVKAEWNQTGGPIVLCVDQTKSADAILDHLDYFIEPATQNVIVLHIDAPEEGAGPRRVLDCHDITEWPDMAALIEARWDVKATAQTIVGSSLPASITAFAASVEASFIVMASHHRSSPGRPSIASTSLAAVQYAPCPVGIISVV